MYIIHDLNNFKADWDSSVLTLGVFDGMHRGHRALIDRLQKRGETNNLTRVLVTYNPHPDLVLGKNKTNLELFTYHEKLSLFQKFDLDVAVFLPFTREFSRMTALRYLREILLNQLKAKSIIIGYDQSFGRGRKGNYKFLRLMSKKYAYTLDRIKAVRINGKIISTSRIKKHLIEGNINIANRMLGHDFFLSGTVIRGFRKGTQLGFPTANLEILPEKVIPAEGVYSAVAEWGRKKYKAMVNIGKNPTFAREHLTVETHILGFNTNIYGKQIRIYIKKRLRDDIKFESVNDLKAQLKKDREIVSRLKIS